MNLTRQQNESLPEKIARVTEEQQNIDRDKSEYYSGKGVQMADTEIRVLSQNLNDFLAEILDSSGKKAEFNFKSFSNGDHLVVYGFGYSVTFRWIRHDYRVLNQSYLAVILYEDHIFENHLNVYGSEPKRIEGRDYSPIIINGTLQWLPGLYEDVYRDDTYKLAVSHSLSLYDIAETWVERLYDTVITKPRPAYPKPY